MELHVRCTFQYKILYFKPSIFNLYILLVYITDYLLLFPRARRARSSLYAGAMTHRQSYPVRSRSSEEFIAVNSPPLDDRKKSHTSTQSTTIDTPPKSPPHYGNTLTVDPPELSEAITGFIDEPEQPSPNCHPIVHRESEEFEIDDIDNVLAAMKQRDKKEHMVNGNARPGSPAGRPNSSGGRPGTPVKRNHAVRFVKPTLTVTLNTDVKGMANESFEEEAQEDENENEENKKNVEPMPEVNTKYSRRRAVRSPALSSITDLQTHRT